MTERPTRPVPRNAPSGEGAKADTLIHLTPRGQAILSATVVVATLVSALLLAVVAMLPDDWTISVLGRVVYGVAALVLGCISLLFGVGVWTHRRG